MPRQAHENPFRRTILSTGNSARLRASNAPTSRRTLVSGSCPRPPAMQTLHPSRAARTARRGFSLAELMVVIVIIGLLATMVVPNVLSRLFTAQTGVARSEIYSIKSALDQFAIENGGVYPESLEALVTPDANGNTFLGSEKLPKDPWKNPYQYEPPQYNNNKILLYSLGKDGAPGGEGENADIYWDADEEE